MLSARLCLVLSLTAALAACQSPECVSDDDCGALGSNNVCVDERCRFGRPGGGSDASTPDADGGADGGLDGGGQPAGPAPKLILPLDGALLIGAVPVKVEVDGGPYDRVLLRRGSVTVLVFPPSLETTWDTRSIPEGSHELSAVAQVGTREYSSETIQVTVDRGPPGVITLFPEPGSASTAAAALIRFSEPILASSVNAGSVRVRVGDAGFARHRLDLVDAGNLLTITLLDPLEGRQEVSVELGTTITDRAGLPLDAGTPWRWTFPGWTRLATYSTSTAALPMAPPALRLNPVGRPLVAWEEEGPGGVRHIQVRRYDGAGFPLLGPPLSADATSSTSPPALGLGQTGVPVVAWRQADGGVDAVHVRRWTGSSWATLGAPLLVGATSISSVRVEVDPAGAPVVCIRSARADGGEIEVLRFDGQDWITLGAPISQGLAAGEPSMGLTTLGLPILAWHESADGGATSVVLQQWDGSGWSTLGALPGETAAQSPSVTSYWNGSFDQAFLAWSERDVDGGESLFLTLRSGAGWQEPNAVPAVPGLPRSHGVDLSLGDGVGVLGFGATDGGDSRAFVSFSYSSYVPDHGPLPRESPTIRQGAPAVRCGQGSCFAAVFEREVDGGSPRVGLFELLRFN